jgi:hypothetical protein
MKISRQWNKALLQIFAVLGMQSIIHRAWLILIAVLFFCADCGNGSRIQETDLKVLDLTDRFSPAESSQNSAHFEQNTPVIRKGVAKKALIISAPVSIHASLQGISGEMVFKGWAAPVFNIGDGLEMKLFLRRDGNRHPLGVRTFDAGRKAEDRAWVPIDIPLSLTGMDQLEIEVTAGDQGDLTADWLALSELTLLPK